MNLAERYLRHLPAANRTERAAGLELLARAGAAAGALDRARRASADLDAIAAAIAVPVIEASASMARGHRRGGRR